MPTFAELRSQNKKAQQQTSESNTNTFAKLREQAHKEIVKQPIQQITPKPIAKEPIKANNNIPQYWEGIKEATKPRTGYYIGGRPIGDGRGNSTYDNSPLNIIGADENGDYIIKEKNGKTSLVNKNFVSDTPEGATKENINAAIQNSDASFAKLREQQYNSMNPVQRFIQKSTDIGFRQDNETPSLGNPAADVASNIVGGILGLTTPTGGGSSLGGAMNSAGDIVQAGIQKFGTKGLSKLPKVVQTVAPRMAKEVGEGLVYSASKAPEYTAKDFARNAVEDATLGTGLGFLMDGAKMIPKALKDAKINKDINAKSKAIDSAYKDLETNMFASDGVKTQRLRPEPPKAKDFDLSKTNDYQEMRQEIKSQISKLGFEDSEKAIKRAEVPKKYIQLENDVDLETAKEYAEMARNNSPIPPVSVYRSSVTKDMVNNPPVIIGKDGNRQVFNQFTNDDIGKEILMVGDGNHRSVASMLLGKDTIPVDLSRELKRDLEEIRSSQIPLPKNDIVKKIEPLKKIEIAKNEMPLLKRNMDMLKKPVDINLNKNESIETSITKLERSKSMLEFQGGLMKGKDTVAKQSKLINNLNSKIESLKAKQKLIPDDVNELKTYIKSIEEQKSKGIEVDLQLFAEAKEKLRKLERGFSKNIRTDNYIDDSLRKSFEEQPLTYDPLSNKETLSKAEMIYSKGFDVALDEWNRNLGNFRPEDIPLSKMLANKAIENGNMDLARRIISDSAEKLTKAGQYSQAARILRQADSGATNIFVQGQLDKLNKDGDKQYGKKWKDIQLSDEELKMMNDMEGKSDGEREKIMEEIFNRITKRLPVTNMEKFDAWRRMAMLLNPKTHVRNVVGNFLMKGLRVSSDKIGAVLEKVTKVPEGQRTKALRWKSDKTLLSIVDNNWESNKKDLLQEGRFDIESLRFLNREKPIFKTKWLEKVNQFSKDTLNLEDMVFFKDAYKDSLGQYLKSNNLNQVTKQAQEYATDKAMEATFKKTNQLSTWIQQAKAKGGLIGKGTEALIPFSKTPSNILKTSMDYSPAGFINLLYNKNKTSAQVIETISKGLTGTALVGVGCGLASMGWMRLNRKNSANAEEILGLTGEQPNSINTPLGSYTFDWAQPFAVPLAMGVAVFESIKEDEDIVSTVTNAIAAGGDTFFSMSMLQNIKGLIGGRYTSTTEGLMELPVSYLEQGFPTLFGQVTRAVDPIKRNTYDTNPIKSFGKKLMAKTPIASKLLEPKLDPFGREQKQNSAVEQFFSPGYTKGKDDSLVVQEVAKLYKATKETDFLPKTNVKSFTYKNKPYLLTTNQITELQREMGRNNLLEISSLINTSKYRNADNEGKIKMVKKITNDNYDKSKENILKKYYSVK